MAGLGNSSLEKFHFACSLMQTVPCLRNSNHVLVNSGSQRITYPERQFLYKLCIDPSAAEQACHNARFEQDGYLLNPPVCLRVDNGLVWSQSVQR